MAKRHNTACRHPPPMRQSARLRATLSFSTIHAETVERTSTSRTNPVSGRHKECGLDRDCGRGKAFSERSVTHRLRTRYNAQRGGQHASAGRWHVRWSRRFTPSRRSSCGPWSTPAGSGRPASRHRQCCRRRPCNASSPACSHRQVAPEWHAIQPESRPVDR